MTEPSRVARHSGPSPARPPRRRLLRGAAAAGVAASLGGGTLALLGAAPAIAHRSSQNTSEPVTVTVFSPGAGDHSGSLGANFVVDLAIDATTAKDNPLISHAAGYGPYYNTPGGSSFHPGADPGAPGLVVELSGTPDKPGTPFQGPNTNLAGLFQINGNALVSGGRNEEWSTWQVGKAMFGAGPSTLTVFVVKGTAPAVVTPGSVTPISNVVKVPFNITG
ncbi:hypothetical protein [Conexibacter sp. DBS9H8]|uniref:hypothetical protein n=1 Tax=Conexibacter sp. DBS9H8 TaxID=2937801 RepID=UPI00200C3A09|nr:hypothetical protein [Conexibacter sp. DBS9H8]